jgi:4-amino-4-deoxy-L-arabinose transferase-like glycosyltransferase
MAATPADATTDTAQPPRPAGFQPRRIRWDFAIAVILLVGAAFFRLHHLGTTPPGLQPDELLNAQLSDRMRQGLVSVIYSDVTPAREGLYTALLATSTTLTGRGMIMWRLPSVWVSLLSLAATFALMRRLFGERVALMVLGLMAVTFWPVWMSRVVLHITLIPLVATLVGYTFVRAFQAPDTGDASLWFTVGGLALGVSQYTHVTAWTLPVIFVAFVVYLWITNRERLRPHLGNVFYALLLAATLNLPLIIFMLRHPGVRELVPVAEQANLITRIPGRLLSTLAGLALRGDMLPLHNLPGRPVYGPLIGLLMVVGLGVSIRRWRRASYGIVLIWLLVGMLPTAFLPRKPDFESMTVILPVVFVFPAVGLLAIYRWIGDTFTGRARHWALSATSALVTVLVVGNTISTYRDYFIRWPARADVQAAYQSEVGALARYLDTSRDPTQVSICSIPVNKDTDPFALSNQELLSYLMHRRGLPIRYYDCTQSLVLANGGESQRLIFPRGRYFDHLPGPLLAWMAYAHDEGVPGVGPDVVMRLDVADRLADQVGAFITTAPTAWPPESGEVRLADLPVTFGANVTFLGYTLRDSTVQPTDWIELTTYWRLDGPPPDDLTLFAHMLGSPVVVIAQKDSLGPQINTLHTRDVFLQYSMIQTPGGVTPGLYALSVGLYFPGTNERLPAFENGSARADRLFLQRIAISR